MVQLPAASFEPTKQFRASVGRGLLLWPHNKAESPFVEDVGVGSHVTSMPTVHVTCVDTFSGKPW